MSTGSSHPPPPATDPSPAVQSHYPLTPTYWTPLPESQVTLRDVMEALRSRWKLVAVVTLFGTAAATAYALLATPIYRAQATIAPPQSGPTNSASAALAAFGGLRAEIADSLGFSVGSSDARRLETLLSSHRLLERVVGKYDLLPALFPDVWNANTKTWTETDPDEIPNVWDAHKTLEKIYRVKVDPRTSTIKISFEFESPEMAVKILRYLLTELASIIQEDELGRLDKNVNFIKNQLSTATDPIILSRLQSLLSEQVERAMMAQNTNQIAYELLDPPAASDEKVRPQRKIIVASSFLAALALSALASCVAHLSSRQRSTAH